MEAVGVAVGQDALRPHHDALPLGCEALESALTPNQRHVELLLQLADRLGQRRLGDMADLGSSGEVTLPRERDQVLKLAE
jgi:hypothetical protein